MKNVVFTSTVISSLSAQSTNKDNLSLLYNEYIVYDEAQAILRYLIHAEMEY